MPRSLQIAVVLPLLFFAAVTARAQPDARVCAAAATAAEREFGIPRQLLAAVSLAETARWNADSKEKYAWPWTVTWDGKGRHYPTKDAAIRTVRTLRDEGVRNIDVGCMQINLHYHPDAFETLEQAFDPAANARYAGEFLSALWKTTKSWNAAVSRYHSSDPDRARRYRKKVFVNWNAERHRVYREAREARIAAYRERIAARGR